MSDDAVLRRAAATANVEARAGANRRFGDADFDGWVGSWLATLPAGRVLDLCCGTGNQLVLYAARDDCRELTGVDISPESLDVAGRRLSEIGAADRATLLCVGLDETFRTSPVADATFDLVSCFYGLYYAADPAAVLAAATDRLAPGGHIAVVGPYGANNRTLFDLLSRHLTLPDLVVRSATTFMEHEVAPALERRLALRRETFVNRISYPDASALLDYWRASTFYEPDCEDAVAADIAQHFRRHDAFVVEKHVMAAIGKLETR